MNSKKTLIYAAIVVLVGIGVYAGYHMYIKLGPRSGHFIGVTSTPLEQESIGGVSLYQSMKDLKPAPVPDRDNALFDYYIWNNEMQIATNKKEDKIIRIIADSGSSTAKGIRPGDSQDHVIESYGKNFYERTEQGAQIIGYVDKKLNRSLEFWFAQGKVDRIRLDIGSME